MRILVVDDMPEILKPLSQELRRLGHSVVEATDGVNAICGFDDDIDLVITDLNMPLLNGYALARFLREELDFKGPIILHTADCIAKETKHITEVIDKGNFEQMEIYLTEAEFPMDRHCD